MRSPLPGGLVAFVLGACMMALAARFWPPALPHEPRLPVCRDDSALVHVLEDSLQTYRTWLAHPEFPYSRRP